MDNYPKQVKLQCTECNNIWTSSYDSILRYNQCPICNPKPIIIKEKKVKERIVLSEEEMQKKRLSNYQYKIALKSNATIQILSYTNAREKVTAKCLICGHEWTNGRADHLLERCHCPICKSRV